MLDDLRLHLQRLGAKHKAALKLDEAGQSRGYLDFIVRIMTRALNAERSSVFIVDPANATVWLKAGTGLAEHEIEVPTKGSIVGQVIDTGKMVMRTGLEREEGAHRDTDARTGFVTRDVLCVPILDPDVNETVGALQVLNRQGGGGFSQEDAALLEEMARHVRARVARIYLDQEIFGLSETVLNAARRLFGWLVGALAVLLIVLLLVLFVWVLVPTVSSG